MNSVGRTAHRMPRKFALDAFCLRQFDDPNYKGTQLHHDKMAFEAKINELFDNNDVALVDGYAPFCKHLFVPNFVGARLSSATITPDNAHLLQSDYISRVPTELPVLTRWFPLSQVTPGIATYLDVILYSREQIEAEHRATGHTPDTVNADVPWGIISVKAQNVPHELPMNPITMMRNALGKDEGGSGVPLKREAYLEAVAYWSKNAVIQ
ncbi:hypothetical protein H310_12162 [Aphanomyces invadans]|uniref:Flagellar associated protein n=1 Tax=Aphanomyces invadans TaxID=157072 RepID=A0A024TLC2_9STRA|nr:hypothetical protein H310_12162 [Aphanomyces invadans]ETV94162.1 hypothetical protein H310_12162 [Aphanomyces invadans]|eukprot:XP_008877365.1 hypothetical protein H310_12162 [Aphanomyces invadans]